MKKLRSMFTNSGHFMNECFEFIIKPKLFFHIGWMLLLASFFLSKFGQTDLAESVSLITSLLCAMLILRPFLRKGLEQSKHDLHHIDYGLISDKAGEGSSNKQEKADLEAQYYGSILLFFSITTALIFKLF